MDDKIRMRRCNLTPDAASWLLMPVIRHNSRIRTIRPEIQRDTQVITGHAIVCDKHSFLNIEPRQADWLSTSGPPPYLKHRGHSLLIGKGTGGLSPHRLKLGHEIHGLAEKRNQSLQCLIARVPPSTLFQELNEQGR